MKKTFNDVEGRDKKVKMTTMRNIRLIFLKKKKKRCVIEK